MSLDKLNALEVEKWKAESGQWKAESREQKVCTKLMTLLPIKL